MEAFIGSVIFFAGGFLFFLFLAAVWIVWEQIVIRRIEKEQAKRKST